MLGLGNSMTTAASPEGEAHLTRTVITIMPSGSPKSSTCTYGGTMDAATLLNVDPLSPQVGDEITKNNPPAYTPIPTSAFSLGSNFKVTITILGTPKNYTLGLSNSSGKTLITAVTAC